jgi:hypothetical protein
VTQLDLAGLASELALERSVLELIPSSCPTSESVDGSGVTPSSSAND